MKIGTHKMRCPFCGVTLSVNIKEEYIGRSIKCPRCNKITPLADFEMIDDADNDVPELVTENNEEERTIIDHTPEEKNNAGILRVIGNEKTYYRLHTGENVIGRDGEGSKADFKIDTPNAKRMSREHITIIVEEYAKGSFKCSVKLYKERVNTTYINDEKLEYGDCIILKDGYKIDLPGVSLLFEKA